jgi:hypothetical protein
MHEKHTSGLDQHTLDMRNQDNIDDAWEDWVEGIGEAPPKTIVRLFGRWTPSNAMVRWLLAILIGIFVVCTLLTLSSCTEMACVATRAGGYTGPHPTCQAARPTAPPATAALKATP